MQVTERDIVFDCPHCGGELVVDMDGAGMEVNCTLCGGGLKVPEYDGPSLEFLQAATAKLAKAIQGARNAAPKKFHFEGRPRDELKQSPKRAAASDSREPGANDRGERPHSPRDDPAPPLPAEARGDSGTAS